MASLSYRLQAAVVSPRIALLLAATVLSGCIPRSRPPERLPPEPEPVTRPERPSRLPADETRNRVAVLVPLSGPNAELGQSILNAANLALLDTGGDRFRITAYDTQGGAAAAANEALADGNGLFLGPLLAEDVRRVAPLARSEGVPVVAFSNDVSVAGDGVFVMGTNPAQSIDRVIGYARSRGIVRFGGLVPADTYGARAAPAITASVQAAGAQLGEIQTFDRSPAGIRAAAGRLGGGGRIEAVLIAAGAPTALLAAPVVRQGSPQPRLLGTELWASETNIGATPALRGAWFAAPSDINFSQFRTRYRTRFNRQPMRLSTLGYDAVLLAVRIAGDWPVGRPFPDRALIDPTGFSGVDGAFRFSRAGVVERALEVREVQAGTTRTVSPAPTSFD